MKFANSYKFSNHDINKFILLLRKGVCLYDYMDDWEKFNEILLPEKEDFYSYLNIEDITGAYYKHAQRVSKGFETKNLGKYHNLYIQSDTLLLIDFFNDFENIFEIVHCLEIYEFGPAHCLSAPGLVSHPVY